MSECCCKPQSCGAPDPSWVRGRVQTPAGEVKRVSTVWSGDDRRGALRCRSSNRFRMNYRVDPGLYAAGDPRPDSPVFVSANYKLSFDHLRRAIDGVDSWILVLDTKGINVWCAAGKKTFGTEELVSRMDAARLSQVVSHRIVVVPQLGASGVSAPQIRKQTGFRVLFGPVRARDIPAYIEAGFQATTEMRRTTFSAADRLVLTPMELVPALRRYFPWFALAALVIGGLRPRGVFFADSLSSGGPLLALGLTALLSGSLLTPLALPWIPTRSFAVKGWLVQAAVMAAGFPLWWRALDRSIWLGLASLVFFPAASSYLALNFTGSSTFTSPSGVKKELRFALPFYLASAVAAGLLFVAAKIVEWF